MTRRTLPSTGSNARDGLESAADRLGAAIQRRVAVDLRALAAFRIAIGTLLFVDLLRRARHLEAFYTDAGVLPLEAFHADYASYSLHALSGAAWAQWLLFALAGAFALALAVGYRTRIVAVVSWILLLSLQARNPMVLNGGDTLLSWLLFWGLFLPLGERWSLDARRARREHETERTTLSSVATLALLGQVVLVYATNAVHKSKGDQWLNGEAVVYVFSLDQFTIGLGNALADHHALLEVMTYAWIGLVALSPLLLLCTGLRRAALASLFAGAHLGMLATMRLDLFPLIAVTALLPFYPPVVWDVASRSASRLAARLGIAGALERLSGRVARVAPGFGPAPGPGTGPEAARDGGERPRGRDSRDFRSTLSRSLARVRDVGSTVIPAVFLVLVVLSNAQAAGVAAVPDRADPVFDATRTDQSWRMFAPDPLSTDGWYVVPGHLENGSEVDALHESAVSWDRPPNVEEAYPSARWRKYLSNVWSVDNENHRSYLGNYLCDRWNREHDTALENVTIHYAAQPSQPYNETEPIHTYELHEHDCSGDLVQSADD